MFPYSPLWDILDELRRSEPLPRKYGGRPEEDIDAFLSELAEYLEDKVIMSYDDIDYLVLPCLTGEAAIWYKDWYFCDIDHFSCELRRRFQCRSGHIIYAEPVHKPEAAVTLSKRPRQSKMKRPRTNALPRERRTTDALAPSGKVPMDEPAIVATPKKKKPRPTPVSKITRPPASTTTSKGPTDHQMPVVGLPTNRPISNALPLERRAPAASATSAEVPKNEPAAVTAFRKKTPPAAFAVPTDRRTSVTPGPISEPTSTTEPCLPAAQTTAPTTAADIIAAPNTPTVTTPPMEPQMPATSSASDELLDQPATVVEEVIGQSTATMPPMDRPTLATPTTLIDQRTPVVEKPISKPIVDATPMEPCVPATPEIIATMVTETPVVFDTLTASIDQATPIMEKPIGQPMTITTFMGRQTSSAPATPSDLGTSITKTPNNTPEVAKLPMSQPTPANSTAAKLSTARAAISNQRMLVNYGIAVQPVMTKTSGHQRTQSSNPKAHGSQTKNSLRTVRHAQMGSHVRTTSYIQPVKRIQANRCRPHPKFLSFRPTVPIRPASRKMVNTSAIGTKLIMPAAPIPPVVQVTPNIPREIQPSGPGPPRSGAPIKTCHSTTHTT